MLQTFAAVLLVLHGMVHLLYLGQSSRLFELKEGMGWPDGSWALTPVLGPSVTRSLASGLMVVAGLGLALGGAALLLRAGWWQIAVVGAAILSTGAYIFLWDGKLANLDGQGAVGILINLAILVIIFGAPLVRSGL